MNPELEIVNVVASGQLLDKEVNLDALEEDLNLSVNDHQGSGKDLDFEDDGCSITLYTSGKYIVRAPSEDKLYETNKEMVEELQRIGFIDESEAEELASPDALEISNYVGHADLNRSINLFELPIVLGLDKTNYQPSDFPAVITQEEKYGLRVSFFESGAINLPGADSKEQLENVLDEVVSDIEEFAEKTGL